MWHHKLRKGGLVKTLADIGSGENAGIGALSEDLTINGQTVTNTFRYEGRNATTGLWTATTGENLTGQGSGGSVGLDTPLPGLTDKAAGPDGTRYWKASGNAFADITTEDFAFEALVRFQAAAVRIFDKYISPNGVMMYRSGSSLAIVVGDGTVVQANSGTLTEGAWYHLMAFYKRSGSFILYANGDAGAAASSRPGSLTVASPLTLAATSGGGGNLNAPLAYAAMWKQDGWLDTHLQAALAQERFARLTGIYSDRYGGPDHSLLRNSVATLEKQSIAGPQKLFTVGARWPRIERVPDKNGRYGSGLRPELSHTNLLTYSEQFDNAAWSSAYLLAASVTPNTHVAPNGEMTADTLSEDATAASGHHIGHGFTQIVAEYGSSLFVKPINRRWIQIRSTSGTYWQNFDVASGVLGNSNNVNNARIRYLGNGWCHIWYNHTGLASGCLFRIAILDDDQSDTFNGANQDSFAIWGAQLIEGIDRPVSYIKTEAASVARLVDRFKYTIAPQLPDALTVAMDFLVDWPANYGGIGVELSDGGASDRHLVYAIGSVEWHFGAANGGVTQWSISSDNNGYRDGLWHEHRGATRQDEARMYLDGTEIGTADTSCDMPVRTQMDIGSTFAGGGTFDGLVRVRLLSGFRPDKDITDFGEIMARASGYISTPAAVAQSTSYANVGGTFTSVALSEFTLSAAGVLTYTGTDTKRFVVQAAMSGSISSGTPEVTSVVEKNGTAVTSSESKRDVGGSGIGAWAVFADVELANGDTVNFATKVDSGTPNLTMEAMSIVVHEYP